MVLWVLANVTEISHQYMRKKWDQKRSSQKSLKVVGLLPISLLKSFARASPQTKSLCPNHAPKALANSILRLFTVALNQLTCLCFAHSLRKKVLPRLQE
jgi:hypothetical protein